MTSRDLHKLALRLKIIELLRLYAEGRLADPAALWQRTVCPN